MNDLDLVDALALDVAADAHGVVRHAVDHAAVGAREIEVVLEEVAVPVDVGHDHLLVDRRVALEQIGVTGVVVDDHFVDLREAVLVALWPALRNPFRSANADSAWESRRRRPPRSCAGNRGPRRWCRRSRAHIRAHILRSRAAYRRDMRAARWLLASFGFTHFQAFIERRVGNGCAAPSCADRQLRERSRAQRRNHS